MSKSKKSVLNPGFELAENVLTVTHLPTVGMQVVDDEGSEGSVVAADDLYNILVRYPNGGQGLYCLVTGCSECTPDKLHLYKKEETLLSLSNPMIEFPETSDQAQFEMNVPEKNRLLLDYQHKNGVQVNALGHPMLLVSSRIKSLTMEMNGKVVYWTSFVVQKHLNFREAIQNVVWTDETVPELRGFARRMMLEYFLTTYDAISTYEIQYPMGQRMWRRFVSEVIHDYNVYVVISGAIAQRINDLNMLNALHNEIWGDTFLHKSVRLTVSKIELPIEIED